MSDLLRKQPHSPATKALVAGGITAAFLLAAGVAHFVFGVGRSFPEIDFGVASGMVGETVIKQMTAPDGKHTAVIVERGGDATVGFFRRVVLCDGSGGCSASRENIVASDKNAGIFNLGWPTNDKLVVYHGASELVVGDSAKNGVKIECVPMGQ